MTDVLTITDLESAKKHDTFHSEVITGKAGGLASGADIETATNAVTGQVQTTLPKVLRDVGFKPASFNFVNGGTLGLADADKCIHNPAPAGDNNWYSWGGNLPHTVAPGTDPTLPGSGYVPRTDVVLRDDLPEIIADEVRDNSDVIAQRPSFNALPRLLSALAGYNEYTDPAINIVGLGSSVGNGASLPDPSTQAPVKYLASKLKSCLDVGNVFNINSYNKSVDGSTISEWETPFNQVIAEGHTPKLLVLAYGMNDSGADIFNAGQTYPAIEKHLRNIITKSRSLGSDVIVMTTPHHKCSAITYALNPANPQYYPTYLAAPVGVEAMTPPASKSNITGDFTSSGTQITVSARHLRVNQMFRKVAAEFGVPVIDAEYFWFKALEKYGEAAMFNTGELLHPNLLGHQQSYHAAIDMFIEGLQRQASQSIEAQLYGNIGINSQSPAAVLDIEIPYTSSPLDSLVVKARTGATGADGVKRSGVVWKVDAATGDLVGYGNSLSSSASVEVFRFHTTMSGGVAGSAQESIKFYGGEFDRIFNGGFNVSGANAIATLPTNCQGKVSAGGMQSGLGRKFYECLFVCKAGVVTFGTPSVVGDNVFSISATGNILQLVAVSPGTNFNCRIDISTGI
jgi:lysophospholipase L1-like esterase